MVVGLNSFLELMAPRATRVGLDSSLCRKRTRTSSENIDLRVAKKAKLRTRNDGNARELEHDASTTESRSAISRPSTPRQRSAVSVIRRDARGRSRTAPIANFPNAESDNAVDENLRDLVAEDKRILRSQDGETRTRSDLAVYFPNYKEIISLQPPKTNDHVWSVDTAIELVDDVPNRSLRRRRNRLRSATTDVDGEVTTSSLVRDFIPDDLNTILHDATKVDLSLFDRGAQHMIEDPLGDALFVKGHRRAERRERQYRNIERERAQHEKIQLDRILDGLKGPDWLRVMGVCAITDTEKKLYRPKRNYFIGEVEALVEKFKIWKEEEKRRRLEDKLLRREGTVEPANNLRVERNDRLAVPTFDRGRAMTVQPGEKRLDEVTITKTKEEAKDEPSEVIRRPRRPYRSRRPNNIRRPQTHVPIVLEELGRPFTSFYNSYHLRQAVLHPRRSVKTMVAFGAPIPFMKEQDFILPSDILTDIAIKAAARSRRARRRDIKAER